ncbi:MAG: arginine--tRNA ligase [Phycisphaerales bacterium]
MSRETSSNPMAILDRRFRAAIAQALGDPALDVDPAIKPSANPQFGDFQANAAMGLAKSRGMNPRELAQKIAANVDLSGVALAPEVAGPGFINIRLDVTALDGMLAALDDDRLGVPKHTSRWGVTIDLCGVNVAKQMHVGHLRATIIGDCLARVFERLGRVVHRENHLGDWGVPIAMTLAALRRGKVDLDRLTLDDLNTAYRAAQAAGKGDEAGLQAAIATHAGPHRIIELTEQNDGAREANENAKRTLLKLQGGDPELLRDWHKLIDCTMKEVFETARVLNVTLGPEHSRGESFFRERLGGVVESFLKAGLAKEDKGAIVVPFADRDRPLLIRKSDGGFLYATTDLAALRFRVQELESNRVVYVVDARQRDHFKDVFDAAALIGWDRLPDGTQAKITHLGFGAVLGKDKRPLKTRSGENFTLKELLDEAVERGTAEVTRRSADPNAPTHGMPASELAAIGDAVGIAAVKYADLSSEVTRDYVFDLDRMIAFEGDTGPYIQYAHARISSILAKSGEDDARIDAAPFAIREPSERALALHLLRYGSTVEEVAAALEPNRLCAYLQTLANVFNGFYQACPVLKSEDEATRLARLRLCLLTRRVLADGLGLLGLKAPSRM